VEADGTVRPVGVVYQGGVDVLDRRADSKLLQADLAIQAFLGAQLYLHRRQMDPV